VAGANVAAVEKIMGELGYASRQLARQCITFTASPNGCQLQLKKGNQLIDFWPSTGLWWVQGSRNKRKGLENLIRYMKRKGNI